MITKLSFPANTLSNPYEATHGFSFSSPGKFWPDAISDYFFSMKLTEDSRGVVIPNELIAEYQNALQLIEKHEDAVRRLSDFLREIEMETSSAKWSAEQISRIFYSPSPEYDELSELQLREAVDGLFKLEIREPSLLEFREQKGRQNPSVLAVKTLATEPGSEPPFYEEITLVFEGGRWAFSP